MDAVHEALSQAIPPRGRWAGADAGLGSLTVTRGEESFRLPNTAALALRKGDIVELAVGGGGGWGDPALRDAGAVAGDVADGLLTHDRALAVYPAYAAAQGGAPAS